MDQFYNYCLQGDVSAAYEYLKTVKSDEASELRDQYYRRFFSDHDKEEMLTDDPWVQGVIDIYYDYFRTVLTKSQSQDEAEKNLAEHLTAFLQAEKDYLGIDEAEKRLQAEFENRGYYFLGGKTLPYYGPYIWRKMERKQYHVSLPLGTQELTVFFMDDFLLMSWLHFATFGKKSTGGWAKSEGVYCVKEGYSGKWEKPEFTVSFLKHEAQHFYDYKHFPHLDAVGLEYRAKLVELIYDPTHRTFIKFLRQAKKDSQNPHLTASHLIVTEMSKMLFQKTVTNPEKWTSVPMNELNELAKKLFMDHTQKLERDSTVC